MENIEIKDLIKNGSTLSKKTKDLIDNWDTRCNTEDTTQYFGITDEYLIWLDNVNRYFSDYFKNNGIKQNDFVKKIKDAFVPSFMETNYSIWGKDIPHSLFNDIYNKIVIGVKILEEFTTKYNIKDNKNTKIILRISKKDLTISKKDSGFICYFQKREGDNQRFKRLIKIIESKNISASDLIEYIGSGTKQNLSGENKKVNKFLKNKLGLIDDVIINDGNTGYKLDEKYEIEFIK